MDAIGNFIGNNSGGISSLLGTGAQLYGQQNAAQAITDANTTAANTQKDYLSKAGGYYQPYLDTGASAAGALTKAQSGGPGGTPDYSGFENMPGYQFAINQGTQAIQRNAAAQGNAWTPNTGIAVGQYVTGTAMQDYNTYIQQLQASAGIGQSAATSLGNMTYNTGANISQLAANSGQAQAGLYAGAGQTVGGALGAGNPYGSGVNGSAGGGSSGVGGLVSGGLKALGGWLGGGSGAGSDTGGYNFGSQPNYNFNDNSWMNLGGNGGGGGIENFNPSGGLDNSNLFSGFDLSGGNSLGMGGFSGGYGDYVD